jgi:putative ABC transport system substrate-binding protein
VKRRKLSTFLAAAAISPPLVARAQQGGKTYRLAVLTRAGQETDLTENTGHRYWRAWRDELHRLGYEEGTNLVIFRHAAKADLQALEELIRETVKFGPDVIYAPAQNIAVAFKAPTTNIPVVTTALDPVGIGLAASLARPSGNITGLSLDAGLETLAKRVALLKEAVPTVSRMAVMALRQYWEGTYSDALRDGARQVGLTTIGAPLDTPMNDTMYRRLFTNMAREGVDSIYVSPSVENLSHAQLIAELAVEARLPTSCFWRENVQAGGLMAYAVDLADLFRRAAGYVDRILKGAEAANLPIEQPTKFDLVINLKTAKRLGINIPPLIFARADEVIE